MPDDDEPAHIDFAWFYFIGVNKLGMSWPQVGRSTLVQFNRLYRAYKNTFDLELSLTLGRKTYAQAEAEARKGDEWL